MWFSEIKKPWKPWHSGHVKASPSLIIMNRVDHWLVTHSAREVNKWIWTMLLDEKTRPRPFLAWAGSVCKLLYQFYAIGKVGQHITPNLWAWAWPTRWSPPVEKFACWDIFLSSRAFDITTDDYNLVAVQGGFIKLTTTQCALWPGCEDCELMGVAIPVELIAPYAHCHTHGDPPFPKFLNTFPFVAT